ncbi:MAG: hotdog fold thioesterase [Bacteroidales bacterium]|nr:hotdog fold thioesterase [Bacteroidales bacterium]
MSDKRYSPEQINQLNKGTLMEQLGIEYLEAKDGFIKGRMPVDERTFQPYKILHGGATIALAETLASIGSALAVDSEKYLVKGQNVTATHVRSASSGWVYGEAELIHRGKTTHLWNVDIKDEHDKLLSTCRLTIFIAPIKK